MIAVHMKNPFIDDFMDECPKCQPGEALSWLRTESRLAAKAEMDAEKYKPEQEEE